MVHYASTKILYLLLFVLTFAADLHLGCFHAGDSRNFPGKVDELRISKVVRSADWLKASHDTVSDAAFLTFALTDIRVGFHIFFR